MPRRVKYGPTPISVSWARYEPPTVDGQRSRSLASSVFRPVPAGRVGLFASPLGPKLVPVVGPDLTGLVIRRGRYMLKTVQADGAVYCAPDLVARLTLQAVQGEANHQLGEPFPIPEWPKKPAPKPPKKRRSSAKK